MYKAATIIHNVRNIIYNGGMITCKNEISTLKFFSLKKRAK